MSPNLLLKVNNLRQNYQSFDDFCKEYSPLRQDEFAINERKTIMDDYSAISILDHSYGNGSTASWVNILLAELNAFSGTKNIDNEQTKSLARLIAREYKDLKISLLQLFFYKFKCGYFGKFYGKVDPMVITCALKDFVKECEAKRQEYQNEEYEEHKKEEQQWQELQNRAKGHWYRCQKSLIEDCLDDEGKELFDRIEFFGFYENTRTLILSANDFDYEIIESHYFDFFKQAIIKSFPKIRVECRINKKEGKYGTAK